MKHPIQVTHPSLAPLEEVLPYLEEIWNRGMLTNDGPLLSRFEEELANYLQVSNVICVSSGTMALQLSLRSLELEGEVITTPFTFIATANVLCWERCTPVFADICKDSWNIDPESVEAHITDKTRAILAVHVFSNPCDTDALEKIASKHQLKLIYDAAHAISVRKDDHSLLTRGDVSTLSFHATKILNTAEGGACITDDTVLAKKLRSLRFFGFDDDRNVQASGINGKMSELSAALGLANLRRLEQALQLRKEKYEMYLDLLGRNSSISFQKINPGEYNYAYMPVLLDSSEQVESVINKLRQNNIFPRRYFYPALHSLEIFKQNVSLPVAEDISARILCLPLYDSLADEDITTICRLTGECL